MTLRSIEHVIAKCVFISFCIIVATNMSDSGPQVKEECEEKHCWHSESAKGSFRLLLSKNLKHPDKFAEAKTRALEVLDA